MAKKLPAATTKKPAVEKSTLSKAKAVVVHAAESVAGAVSDVADAANAHIVKPVAEAVGIVKKKKAPPAPAKAKVKAKPAAKIPLPAPSKTTAGKMMSKNVPAPAKKDSKVAPKPKSKTKP